MKPILPRAAETEALVWSSSTGWPEVAPPDQPSSLRRIARAVFPARRLPESQPSRS